MLALSTSLCLFAAALFWTCNALEIVIMLQRTSQWGSVDRQSYVQLLPDNIADDWVNKIGTRGVEFAAEFLRAVFWIVFSIPLCEMTWILSRNGTRAIGCNVGIMLFVLAGSWTKWFSSIFKNGMYISFTQMAEAFNLENWLPSIQAAQYQLDSEDGMGWRVLEVNYLVTRGMVWIVNSVEWVCLAAIFTLTFSSVLGWRKLDQSSFGGKWNALGLFIGLLSVVEFVLEILGFKGITFAWIFVALYAGLNRLILVPLWIIILGFQLPLATSKQFDSFDENFGANELELSEDHPLTPGERPPAFTIDDENEEDAQKSPVAAPAGPSSPPAEAFAPAASLAE